MTKKAHLLKGRGQNTTLNRLNTTRQTISFPKKNTKFAKNSTTEPETDSDEHIAYIKPTSQTKPLIKNKKTKLKSTKHCVDENTPTKSAFTIADGFYPINASLITPEAQKAMQKHPNRRLGIDCCMTCGLKANTTPVLCPLCDRIEYCTADHVKKDRPTHERICDGLKQIEADEDYESQYTPLQTFNLLSSSYFSNKDESSEAAVDSNTSSSKHLTTLVNSTPIEKWRWQNVLFDSIENYKTQTQTTTTSMDDNLTDDNTPTTDNVATRTNSDIWSNVTTYHSALRALTKFSTCAFTTARTILGNDDILRKAARAFVPGRESISIDSTFEEILQMQQNAIECITTERELQTSSASSTSSINETLGTLRFHIIGASYHECTPEALVYWNILPELLSIKMNLPLQKDTQTDKSGKTTTPTPPLWKISLVFIGLELPTEIAKSSVDESNLALSPHLDVSFYNGTYETFIESVEILKTIPLQSSASTTTTTTTTTVSLSKSFLVETKQSIEQYAKTFSSNTSSTMNNGKCSFTFLDAFPDVLLGFQMGLTVPEYTWGATLFKIRSLSNTSRFRQLEKFLVESKLPSSPSTMSLYCKDGQEDLRKVYCLTTSSSRDEAIEDSLILTCSYGLEDIIKAKRNSLSSLKVLQSGTLGNDIWYKNAYYSVYSTSTIF